MNQSKIWYDDYTKILHLGKQSIGLGGFTNWALVYHRDKEIGLTYFRIGKLAIALRRKK